MHDPSHPHRSAAPARGSQSPIDELAVCTALRNLGVDPANLQIRIHCLADRSEFAQGAFFLTLIQRRLQISRTYQGDVGGEWISEFLEDARAGIFGEVIGAERPHDRVRRVRRRTAHLIAAD